MYLHLGQSVVIPMGDVVGIFDLDNASYAGWTRDFLRVAEQAGRVINVSDELPKSFALCQRPGEDYRVYISQLSSQTLRGRTEMGLIEG